MGSMPKIVILGGGIAGITCLETLLLEFNRDRPIYKSITLISASKLVKRVVNYTKWGRNLEEFEVSTTDARHLSESIIPEGLDFHFVVGSATSIDDRKKNVHLEISEIGPNSEATISYDILCLCNGSSPRKLNPPEGIAKSAEDLILTVRDTTSVNDLRQKLVDCEKVAIIGNGGIGLELARKISHCDLVWIVRDEFVGRPFLDSGACRFLLEPPYDETIEPDVGLIKDRPEVLSSESFFASRGLSGPALGPHWLQDISLRGKHQSGRKLEILYSSEVDKITYIESGQHPVSMHIGQSKTVDCDIIVSAIGVKPNIIEFVHEKPGISSADGGILIDEQMRTSIKDIYAAGDVVSCERWSKNELWFQMRLWTQARQMGHYCARCIACHIAFEDPSLYFTFDCFSHSTRFFDRKLILLGRYNGQGLSDGELEQCEAHVRMNPNKDYIKLLLREDRVIGAVLVGETGLEETIENLIYDQINVASIKGQLLDGTVDIEDYFD